jgi:YqjK-like protein
MSKKLVNLAKRREHLIAEASAQRLMLTQHIEPLRASLDLADRGLTAVSYVKSHPVWTASAGIALLTLVRPNRVGRWLQRGWLAWQVLRRFQTK